MHFLAIPLGMFSFKVLVIGIPSGFLFFFSFDKPLYRSITMHRITCQPFRALHEAISVSGGEKLPPPFAYTAVNQRFVAITSFSRQISVSPSAFFVPHHSSGLFSDRERPLMPGCADGLTSW